MSQTVYDVAVLEEEPFVQASSPDASGNRSFSGMTIDLIKHVAKEAGFSYKLRLTDHKSYGYLEESSGQWKGLVSEVAKQGAKDTTLIAGPIPITRGAENVVEFTKPYMNAGVKLLIKRPVAPSEGIDLMLEPFAPEVWVMIVLAFIVISLALFLIARFSPFELAKQGRNDTYNPKSTFGLRNSFLFVCTTMALQGYRQAPRSFSGRILICMWLMFTIFVLVAYVANLAAILTTRGRDNPHRLPFSNAQDLATKAQVKLGAVRHGYVYNELQHSIPYKYISESSEWVDTVSEGVQRVKDFNGDFAVLLESAKADYVVTSNCDVMIQGPNIASFGYGLAVKKDNTQLATRLNDALLTLREDGRLQELTNKYFHDRRLCPEPPAVTDNEGDRTASSLDMNDMAIPFLFLFLGLIGAAGAVGAEIYYLKWKAERADPDSKARQPLNTEASKAPKTSPPPPPIYKVNNKLEQEDTAVTSEPETGAATDGDGADTDKDKESPSDDKIEADQGSKPDVEVQVEVASPSPAKVAAEITPASTEVVNEVA